MSKKYLLILVFISLISLTAVSATNINDNLNCSLNDDCFEVVGSGDTINDDSLNVIESVENNESLKILDDNLKESEKYVSEDNLKLTDKDALYGEEEAILETSNLVTSYGSGKTFNVKAVMANDTSKVIEGMDLKFKIYTNNGINEYFVTTNENGIAKYDFSKLAIGNYKIEISSDSSIAANMISSTIKIIKANTKVTARAIAAYYKQPKIAYVKIVDKLTNKPINKAKVLIGVGGKKFLLTTNSKGQVAFKTTFFKYGKYGVSILSKDSRYNIHATSSIFIKKLVTKVTAPSVTANCAQSKFFNIKIIDSINNQPVRGVNVLVKIDNKNYNLKTNSLGIIKINTRYMSVGKHNVVISSNDVNYKINALSNIVINKVVKASTSLSQSTSSSSVTYIGNINTYKFHYSSCSAVKRMNDSNKVYLTRQQAINGGYSPCGICHP